MNRVILLAVAAVSLAAQNRKISEDEVMRVHRATLLIDTHNDITSRTRWL